MKHLPLSGYLNLYLYLMLQSNAQYLCRAGLVLGHLLPEGARLGLELARARLRLLQRRMLLLLNDKVPET
jgi:hypothetical protein